MFSQRLIGPVRTGDMNTKDIDIFDEEPSGVQKISKLKKILR